MTGGGEAARPPARLVWSYGVERPRPGVGLVVQSHLQSVRPTMGAYIYQPDTRVSFAEGVESLRASGRAVVCEPVNITVPSVMERIKAQALAAGMAFNDLIVDVPAFRAYAVAAGYQDRYSNYYSDNQAEKSLEHFLALRLLKVGPGDVFIDLASEHSPVPEIYERLTGAECYSQDIMYPEGIEGRRIGGDACAMPVPDGFATAATLTCSLEHFEGDGDTRLFLELARVLRPGGAVCVIPFYVNTEHVAQTDPTVGVPAGVIFDEGAPVHCVEGWGNRHGRFYSPQTFMDRVVRPVSDRFAFEFYTLSNASHVHDSIYARFGFVARRLSR